MKGHYSPNEALAIALRYYDELRERGLTRDEALEGTVIHFELSITPSELDVFVMARDADYEDRAADWHPSDDDIERWLAQSRPKDS